MVSTRRRAAEKSGSQLLAAVIADDLDAVQRELEHPAAAEWSSEFGVTALHLAAGFAGPAVLAALLAALPQAGGKQGVDAALEADLTSVELAHPLLDDASKETRLAFAGGATPLQIAVYFGDFDAVEQLLATGASPNVPDHAGLTAMHVCSGVCLSGPSSGGLSSPRNPGQRSKQHAGIPAALLAAGGDIFEATVDSAGRRRPPPLLCGGRSVWSMHSAAATAFLEHAAQAHEQGRWVAPVDLSALVRLAVHLRCRPFFHRFWQRGQYYNSIYQLEACITMGHLQAVRQVVPSVRHLLPAQGERLLAKAIETRELAIAQLLLENGARVTMWSVKLALSGMPQPGALRMLLEGGPPEVANMLIASPGYGAYMWTCPVLHLLCSSARRYWGEDAAADAEYRRAAADCMALLAEAGYRPHTYKSLRMTAWGPPLANCNPLEALPELFRIHTTNSWLWAAYERPAWVPTSHSRFPEPFRAAVRCLLLAAHRCASQPGGRSGGATLGQLPPDLLLQIAGAAASPYSAWL